MVPILETERLRLREFCESDLERWAAVMADAATVRYVGNQQLSREETWRRLLTSGGLWPMYGFGYWATERKDDGLLVGHAIGEARRHRRQIALFQRIELHHPLEQAVALVDEVAQRLRQLLIARPAALAGRSGKLDLFLFGAGVFA